MRLLLPLLDKERPAYGLKEAWRRASDAQSRPQSALARLYIDILGIAPSSVDGERLLNWKIPDVARQAAGDFAGLCALILGKRCPPQGRSAPQCLPQQHTPPSQSQHRRHQRAPGCAGRHARWPRRAVQLPSRAQARQSSAAPGSG